MRTLFTTMLVSLCALSALACSQKKEETPRRQAEQGATDGDEDDDEDGDGEVKFTYDGDVKPLLDAKCAKCHGAGAAKDFSTYEKARKAAPKMLTQVKAGKMPKGGKKLADADVAKLAGWIDGGYEKSPPERDPDPTSGPQYTWKSWTKDFLATNCKSCHGPGATPPDVTAYESAKSAAQDILAAVKNGSMPKGGPKVAAAALAKLEQWVDDGAPEDADASGTDGQTDGRTDGTQGDVTYDGQIKSLLQKGGCAGCHASGATPPDLSTKAKAAAQAQAIASDVESGRMPKGGSKMSAADIAAFKAWADGGAK